jgi:hypothetical protein
MCAAQRALPHTPTPDRAVGCDLSHFRAAEARGGMLCGRAGAGRSGAAGARAGFGTECCPQSRISDRFGCTTTHSRVQKNRFGRFTAGGWGTTQTPETAPALGRSPRVLRSCDFRVPATPLERPESLVDATRPALRGNRRAQLTRPSPEGTMRAAPGAPSCPEVERFSAPTSWPPSAAGGGCQVAHTTLHNAAPPREQNQPADAT